MFIKTCKVKRAFRGIQTKFMIYMWNLAKRPSHKRKSKFNIGTKELNTWNYNFFDSFKSNNFISRKCFLKAQIRQTMRKNNKKIKRYWNGQNSVQKFQHLVFKIFDDF